MHSSASSSAYLSSAGPIPNNHEPPTLLPSYIHPPRISDERIPIPRVERGGVAIMPVHMQARPQYTGRFITTLNSRSPPIPRLRPASWGLPSQADGGLESRRLTRSRSSADLRGDSSGEEDLPFGNRTLPPLPISCNPWYSVVRTAPNTSSTPSRDLPLDSGDLSATDSVPSTSFPSR